MASTEQYLAEASRAIRYPLDEKVKQGRVVYAYVVNEQGQAENFTVVESMPKPFMEQTWQALQSMPAQWVPAVARGRAVKTRCYFIVDFLYHPAGNTGKALKKFTAGLPQLPQTYRTELVVSVR